MEDKDLQLIEESKKYILKMGKWMSFFAILMIFVSSLFIVLGITHLLAVFIGYTELTLFDLLDNEESLIMIMGIVCLLTGGLYVYPIVCQLRVSNASRYVVESNDNNKMVEFLKYSKRYWSYMGICIVVSFIIFLLVFIFGLTLSILA